MTKKKKVVLFVDDEEVNLIGLRRYMSIEFPYMKVETTSDVMNVVPWIARNPVDIVVSDYNMPKMNGVELYDSACLDMANVPTWIIFSGSGEESFLREIKRRGLLLVQKPKIKELQQKIAELLE